MTVDERRRSWYRGARVGLTPTTPRRAAGSPPGSASLPAAVGPDSPGRDVPGGCRNQEAADVGKASAALTPGAGRLERLARCQKIQPFQAGDEDLVCANDMVGLLPSRTGYVHDPDEIRRLREAATGWPK